MKSITISSGDNSSCDIAFLRGGSFGLDRVIDCTQYSKVVVLLDEALVHLVAKIKFPAKTLGVRGEAIKSYDSIAAIWRLFIDLGLDRASLIIAIGGGALLDAVGFAASTYMRGVRRINVPSTLLSQVDSSIGGKTAMNFGGVKNIIGSFCSPHSVIIDVDLLTTLSVDQLRSGTAELIKHAIIGEPSLLGSLNAGPIIWKDTGLLEEIIYRSCEFKAEIVKKDPLEYGIRKILNFGHTVGHALEAISNTYDKVLLHGDAVALGMRVEGQIAAQLLGFSGQRELDKLLETYSFPTELPWLRDKKSELVALMRVDKKNVSGSFRLSLPDSVGSCKFNVDCPEAMILEAICCIL